MFLCLFLLMVDNGIMVWFSYFQRDYSTALQSKNEPEFYKDLGGGIMEAFGQLFDEKANLLVYPFKTADLCLTAKSYFPQDHLSHLHQFLVRNNNIIDIANCDDIDTDVRSQDVRQLLVDGNPEWEKLVPDSVRDVIKSKGLFTKGV